MDSSSPRTRSLLRQAEKTEDAGKRAAAEELYRRILSEDPNAVDAWLGLARVIRDPAEEEAAYRQALSLDPDSREAKQALSNPEESDDGQEGVPPNDPRAKERSQNAAAASDETEAEDQNKSIHSLLREEPIGSEAGADQDEFTDSQIEPGSAHIHQELESLEILFCANHPNRETYLRCNRCEKPICSSCARPTPVGYRCPECIREHEDIFYTATVADYLVAAVISFPLALIAGMLASRIGFFAIFLAAVVGSFMGRIVFRAAGRRRGRWLPHLVATSIVIGGLLPLLFDLLSVNLFGALFMGIYIVTASGAAYYQMR